MTSIKKYDRSIIMLTPESGGYALEGHKLAGTALLELRNGTGKLNVTVSGLKASDAYTYKLYLICAADNEATGVYAGAVLPDNKGKASFTWDFDPQNVGNSKMTYDDFNVVALIAKSSSMSQSEIIAPLAGYKGKTAIWKSNFKEHGCSKAEHAESHAEKHVPPQDERHDNALSQKYDVSQYDEILTEVYNEVCAEYNDAAVTAPANDDDVFLVFCEKIKTVSIATEVLPAIGLLHQNLEKHVPKKSVERSISLLTTISGYMSHDDFEKCCLLTAEASGTLQHIPYSERNPLGELASLIDSKVPGKIKEDIVDVFGDLLSHLNEGQYPRLFGVTKKITEHFEGVMEYHAASPEKHGKPELSYHELQGAYNPEPKKKLKSGITGEYTLKEPFAGDDHNKLFKQQMKTFSERFDDITGEQKKQPEHVKPHPQADFNEQKLMSLFGVRKKITPMSESGSSARYHTVYPSPGRPVHPSHSEEHKNTPSPNDKHGLSDVLPINDIEWIQLTPDDIVLLPERFQKYPRMPFAFYAFRKYGYLIFGAKAKKSYYLGIPGVFSEKDRQKAVSLGFKGFLPVGGGAPAYGEFGYWVYY